VTAKPRVSVIIPQPMRFSAGDLTAVARHVEDTGLDGVFVGDHLAGAVPITDSTLALAVAAAATSRIHLGFGVMVLGLRHPAWAAKQLATLQQLSGNRVILGAGLGGAVHGPTAWEAVGTPFRERGARTDAALRVLRSLISGEQTALPNGTELTLTPGAPAPPIWIGGNTAGARRRAVRYGDGWFPSMIPPGDLAAGLAHLAELCAEQNVTEMPVAAVGGSVLLGAHPPESTLNAHITALTLSYGVPADIARQLPLRGSPAAVAERLRSYTDAGACHTVLGLIGDDWRQQCDLLAEAVRLT
jgi:alkanesulfonate monooxygenase SsuD/methylene tetrahydromethanopterin reductase-like flavin-dependent oxidoreductase (luciferase family)